MNVVDIAMFTSVVKKSRKTLERLLIITPGITINETIVAQRERYDPCTAANDALKIAPKLNIKTLLFFKASLSWKKNNASVAMVNSRKLTPTYCS